MKAQTDAMIEYLNAALKAREEETQSLRDKCEGLVEALKKYVDLPVMTFPHPDGINRTYYSGGAARAAINQYGETP